MKRLCVLLLVSLFFSHTAHAQSSGGPIISYQGTITNSDGSPGDGSFRIAVSLWTEESSDHPIWSDEFVTQVTHGVFNIGLGSGKPLPKPSDMNKPLWISVSINGEVSAAFTRLAAVPFALNVADSSITALKLATDYVGSISVNGQKVTGKGAAFNIAAGNGIEAVFDPASSSLLLSLGNAVGGKGAKVQSENSGTTDRWSEIGNSFGGSAPTPPSGWLGTSTADDLIVKTNGTEALRILGGTTNSQFVGINTVSNTLSADPVTRLEIHEQGYTANTVKDILTLSGGGSSGLSAKGGTAMIYRLQTNLTGAYENASRLATTWVNAADASYAGAFEIDVAARSSNTSSYPRLQRVFRIDNRIYDDNGGSGSTYITSTAPNIVAGSVDNSANVDIYGAPILHGTTISGGGGFVSSSLSDQGGNHVTSSWATVSGGARNVAGAEAVGYTSGEDINKQFQTVGGGLQNSAIGDDAVIAGGELNTVIDSAGESAIGGGHDNTVRGSHSVIPGGANLTIGAASFGFNGDISNAGTITDISSTGAGWTNVGYFGNVNLIVGNVDGTARAIRFYEPNTNHLYGGAHYSSFRAAAQPGDILYTLPDTLPLPGEFLRAAIVTGDNVTLKWAPTNDSGGGLAGWLLTGNAGAPPPTNYLGTKDSQAFEIHIHNNTLDTTGGNQRVMRYEEGATSPNILGGSSANRIGTALSGAAILSGGDTTNPNGVASNSSVIAGGFGNFIDTASTNSVISGGANNRAGGAYSVVGGGGGFLGEGPDLPPYWPLPTSMTSFGSHLYINQAMAAWTVVGGGYSNVAYDTASTIAGGADNTTTGVGSVVSGGARNGTSGIFGTVAGGNGNWAGDMYATVSGGVLNQISAPFSTIAGGEFNETTQRYAFIGGGFNNWILAGDSGYSVIAGGKNNLSSANFTFLGGGENDTILPHSDHGVIAGGLNNTLGDSVSFSSITAGRYNIILNNAPQHSKSCFIGAGDSNVIDAFGEKHGLDSAIGSAIVAGHKDTVHESNSFIGAGHDNSSSDDGDFIGAGSNNVLGSGSENGIVAGRGNRIDLSGTAYHGIGASFIGGGDTNVIDGNAALASIPGGDHLIAYMNAQTIMGRYNDTNLVENPLLILGNGARIARPPKPDSIYRSNAFSVSTKGAATVYEMRGPSSPSVHPLEGTTYVDNVLIAYADVAASGAINTSFGVYSVTQSSGFPGAYLVHLDIETKDNAADSLQTASIVVSLRDNDTTGLSSFLGFPVVANDPADPTTECGWSIDATRIGIVRNVADNNPNYFIVHVRPPSVPTKYCGPTTGHAFSFQVFGRRYK
ncbi:MAG: hypothetical protein Q8913_10740 [Bacteroidota bacterium]|nr:hypothetical protein [Bacteroidota bacterium]